VVAALRVHDPRRRARDLGGADPHGAPCVLRDDLVFRRPGRPSAGRAGPHPGHGQDTYRLRDRRPRRDARRARQLVQVPALRVVGARADDRRRAGPGTRPAPRRGASRCWTCCRPSTTWCPTATRWHRSTRWTAQASAAMLHGERRHPGRRRDDRIPGRRGLRAGLHPAQATGSSTCTAVTTRRCCSTCVPIPTNASTSPAGRRTRPWSRHCTARSCGAGTTTRARAADPRVAAAAPVRAGGVAAGPLVGLGLPTPRATPRASYVRGAVDPNTTATKARKRLPFVAERAPDHPRDPEAHLPAAPSPGPGSATVPGRS
jgi:hypothetical protein